LGFPQAEIVVIMSVDHRVSEISSSRPRLRRDVRTHYQEYRGKPSYIIEDTSKGRFFHVGYPEHQFIQCFDGRTTISQALARNAATQGLEALTEQQGEQLLRWLVDNDLLESETSGQGERRREQLSRQKAKAPSNPLAKILFFKIPLGCPDRFLTLAERRLGWLFGAPGLALWLALLIYTVILLAPEWDRFLSAAGQVIEPSSWLRVVLIYAALKVLHELGHGLATKRFGGEVPEWGVQLLAFISPLAYVDASSSWKFASKWRRIMVASAGMYVELAIACLCVIGWIHTDPGPLNTSLHNAVIAATLVTLLFNANPLMRFDGYYILGDLLGIPNLGTKGQQFMKWAGKRALLGMSELPMPPAARQHLFIVPAYGILAAIWKVIIWIGITILISLLFKGAGFILAVASMVVALVASSVKFFRFLFKSGSGPKPARTLVRLGAILGILFFVLFFIRINPTEKALAVVEYAERESIRAGVRGIVTGIHVNDGEIVEKGALLAELSNPDEEAERDQLSLQLESSRIRARSYYQEGKLPDYQAELEVIRGLEEKLRESNLYLDAMRVTAPFAGRVIGRDLVSFPGRWLEVGDEILSLASEDEKALLVSFRQKDIRAVVERENPAITLRLRGRAGEIHGALDRIESKATRAVPHPVMATPNGGPLALRAASDPGSEREREFTGGGGRFDSDLNYFAELDDPTQTYELAHPRFVARAHLTTPAEGLDLREGEWGYLRFADAKQERLAKWLYEGVSTYVTDRIAQARAAAE
jgi:putative peptide zinc metalloprotease protein